MFHPAIVFCELPYFLLILFAEVSQSYELFVAISNYDDNITLKKRNILINLFGVRKSIYTCWTSISSPSKLEKKYLLVRLIIRNKWDCQKLSGQWLASSRFSKSNIPSYILFFYASQEKYYLLRKQHNYFNYLYIVYTLH